MAAQPGLFDLDRRYVALSAAGDPLERLAWVIDFELFRPELEAALARSDRTRGGRLGRLRDPDNTASGVWADTAYIQAYSGDQYLRNVDGFITGGGSFTAMATDLPSINEIQIKYNCG
jgi:hypothetical protein